MMLMVMTMITLITITTIITRAILAQGHLARGCWFRKPEAEDLKLALSHCSLPGILHRPKTRRRAFPPALLVLPRHHALVAWDAWGPMPGRKHALGAVSPPPVPPRTFGGYRSRTTPASCCRTAGQAGQAVGEVKVSSDRSLMGAYEDGGQCLWRLGTGHRWPMGSAAGPLPEPALSWPHVSVSRPGSLRLRAALRCHSGDSWRRLVRPGSLGDMVWASSVRAVSLYGILFVAGTRVGEEQEDSVGQFTEKGEGHRPATTPAIGPATIDHRGPPTCLRHPLPE